MELLPIAHSQRRNGKVRISWVCGGACAVAVYLAAVAWAVHPSGPPSQPERRPNVLVILADDQGWGDLSLHGNSNLQTPNLDRLGREGAVFDYFYVQPVCSPTRAEFLTGRYHPRGGVRDVTRGGERLNLDEYTIAQAFQKAGYATGAFGKWHNGSQYPYHPLARGFGEFYGFTSGHWGIYFDPPLEHNGQWVRGQGYITDDLTDRAMHFIEGHRNRPWFCYLAFNTPHSPFQVPDRFYDRLRRTEISLRYEGPQREDLAVTRAALAMCENIDWNVGRVLTALDRLGLRDNTVVVYFSDNGPNSWRWNGGMRGRKGSTDEGGVRSPCFVRWPGHIRPGTRIDRIAGSIDLLPTLAELAGIELAAAKPLDGKSLAPLLLGQRVPWPDRMLFAHWAGRVSVRTQRFRLDERGRLYDITRDPGQREDVSAREPQIAEKLRDAVQQFRTSVLPKGPDTRPFPVGYRQFPVAWLPARDGQPQGGVRRSASAPNCSYFTNWTRPEDAMTWDIEVHTAGRYEATLYYTCPARDTGATVQLAFGDRRVQSKLTEPFDPPLRGSEYDRVPRQGESYVKDFKPWVLGTLELPAGRGTLELRATKVPGRQVADVRMVVLRLLD